MGTSFKKGKATMPFGIPRGKEFLKVQGGEMHCFVGKQLNREERIEAAKRLVSEQTQFTITACNNRVKVISV